MTDKKKNNALYLLLGAVTRLIGLVTFFSGILIMAAPFFIIWVLLGIDRANVAMDIVMRLPINMLFGDKMGDELLKMHRSMLDDGK